MRLSHASRLFGAAALLAASAPLLAQEVAREPAAQAEADIGLDRPAYPPMPSPRYSERAEQLGPSTGDPEKDSFGFSLLIEAPAEPPATQSAAR